MTTGDDNTFIGTETDAADGVTNSIVIGHSATTTMNNSVALGSGTTRFGLGVAPSNGGIITVNGTTAILTNGGAWQNASDRNVKENFVDLDNEMILKKVSALPMSEWNYIQESDTVRHIGPMAQDFYAAFGLGGNDKTISTIDPSGVALVAIQALYQKQLELEESHKELKTLKQEFASQQSQIESMSSALAELQRLIQPGTITDFTD
jgi:hypothetical protein